MAWVVRGLHDGIVTTRYPARRDEYADTFPGTVAVATGHPPAAHALEDVCPTGAISVHDGDIRLDRGRCILCAHCVDTHPETFSWTPGSGTSALTRRGLIVPPGLEETDEALARTRAALRHRVRRLRRSVHLRHVDAGSDGSEEWEIQALTNPTYDVHRLGIFFTASPRHADILVVTGAGARGMAEPLRRTHAAMPNPLVVIAVGTDAISGGLVGSTYATTGGVLETVPADVLVPGSPPPPFAILHGILLALDRVPSPRGGAVTAGST
jgi:Ni,Fe-hydrogenase III small subunit/ferredoxin